MGYSVITPKIHEGCGFPMVAGQIDWTATENSTTTGMGPHPKLGSFFFLEFWDIPKKIHKKIQVGELL